MLIILTGFTINTTMLELALFVGIGYKGLSQRVFPLLCVDTHIGPHSSVGTIRRYIINRLDKPLRETKYSVLIKG